MSGRKSQKLIWFPAIAHEGLGHIRDGAYYGLDMMVAPFLSYLHYQLQECPTGFSWNPTRAGVVRRDQVLPQPGREVPQFGSPSLTPTEQDNGCTSPDEVSSVPFQLWTHWFSFSAITKLFLVYLGNIYINLKYTPNLKIGKDRESGKYLIFL